MSPDAEDAIPARPHRIQAAFAWLAWVVGTVSGTLGAIYVASDQATGHPVLQQTPVSGIAGTAIAVTYASVGLLLVLRRPGLIVGWLFLGIGVVAGLSNYAWGYVGLGATQGSAPGPFPVVDVAWLNNALTYSVWATFAILLVLLFPDGRPATPAWRTAVVATIAIGIVLAVGLAIEPGALRLFPMFDNPVALTGSLGSVHDPLILAAIGALVLVACLSVWSLVVRYRRGSADLKRQLRWFAWGSALTLAGGMVLIVATLGAKIDSALTDLSWVVFAAASVTLPIAALIAILRDRLYDIDRLISRTFVYGLLTAILAGLYSALIRLFNALFVDVTGQSSETALVLTTLILATTFTPIKKRLEEIAGSYLAPEPAATQPVGLPYTPAAPEANEPGARTVTIDADDLDRRIATIARRVSLEVLAGSARAKRSAQDHDPDQDEHERPDQVAQAREPRPQA